jgi:hypothetical protein
MGTSHKGFWMADWAKMPASALGLAKSTNNMLLEILETDSQLLESIQVKFWSMIRELREAARPRGIEATCFLEDLPLPATMSRSLGISKRAKRPPDTNCVDSALLVSFGPEEIDRC